MGARSIRGTDRSIAAWFTDLRKQAAELGVPLDVPWREMPEAAREIVLRGNGQLRGHSWILCADGAQEVQAACARHAEQISRLCGVPGLPWTAVARRGARGSAEWAEHLSVCGAYDREGQGVLRLA